MIQKKHNTIILNKHMVRSILEHNHDITVTINVIYTIDFSLYPYIFLYNKDIYHIN